MRTVLTILLIIFVIAGLSAQPKKHGRVKRKYRDVEKVSENIPEVVFRGRVRDIYRNTLPGVCIEIEGLKRKVHTNEDGLFILTNLPAEMVRIKFSYTGFLTKTIDYVLTVGQNTHYVALDRDPAYIEQMPAGIQKREQHIQDIPAAVTTFSGDFTGLSGVNSIDVLSGLVPGVIFNNAGAGSMGMFINGSSGHSGFPGVSPSVEILTDDIPASFHTGFSTVFFDIERVEFVKGAQNTLYGNHATGGAVNIVTRKPEDKFSGYLIAGGGNFSNKEIEGAVNVPVLEDRIFLGAAGTYRNRNGFVENSPGGRLDGVNSAGGRLSLELLPFYNHKVNISANYIKNDQPGLALINPWLAGSDGNGIYDYRASLDSTGDHGFQQEIMDASLLYRIFRNENNYLTSVTSYRTGTAADIWDADGTGLTALGMDDQRDAKIFYQELRYNFSRKSRTNGSFGINYQRAVNSNSNQIISDDRMVMEIITHPGNFLMPGDNRFPVNPQPLDADPASGIVLTGDHSENFNIDRKTRYLQAYLHFTHQLTRRVFFTGGIRAAYEMMQLKHEASFIEGASSFLGNYAGSAPNLIYKPSEEQVINNNDLILSGQAGIKYRLNENFNFFIDASHVRKPNLIQFTWDSRQQVFEGEKVKGLSAGWKVSLAGRLFWSATGFYRMHENVQAVVWRGTKGDGLLNGEGRAISYGAESGVKAALIKGLELFGNYSWFYSQFDSTDVNGLNYVYAGNRFAYAPEHSYSAGLIAKTGISEFANLIVTPWYIRRSQFWFTETNSPGLSQNGYGVFNLNAALELVNLRLTLSFYGQNILEQKYLTGGGHWGGLFGIPVVQPGTPRMFGGRLKWEF